MLSGLGQLAQIEERLAALNERVEQAPGELLSLERELEAEQEGGITLSATGLDDQPLDELETRRQEAVFELQQLQDRLAEANAQLLSAEQAIAEAALDDPLIASGHPVLERALQINRDLNLELLEANDRSHELIRAGSLVRSQLDRVRQLQRSLNEQIRAIRGSVLLSRILREQRESLPQVESRRGLQDEIADLRLRQFDLVRQRAELRQSERLARQRLREADAGELPRTECHHRRAIVLRGQPSAFGSGLAEPVAVSAAA